MLKKINGKIKRYGYLAASLAAAALVAVASLGAGTYCWAVTYQPEPPK